MITWAIFIGILVAVVGAFLGVWAFGRSTARAEAKTGVSNSSTRPEQWGVRIHAPAKDRACPQVQDILGKEFQLDAKPPLPLPNCTNPNHCECRYIKLSDRRKGDRRSGHERREKGHRYEKDKLPRRSGRDRRKKVVDWF